MSRLLRAWSRPFDVHKLSEHASINAITEHVYQEIAARRQTNRERIRDGAKLKKHLKALLLDLYVASQERAPGSRRSFVRWIGIARAKNAYRSEVSRYRKLYLSYRHLIGTLDDLVELGYVKQVKGFHDRRTGVGYQTRIRPRSKLLDLMRSQNVSASHIQLMETETIILRDSEKREIEYEDTDETCRWRANLQRINARLAKLRIRLDITDQEFRELNYRMVQDRDRGAIDYGQHRLRRIFNNGSFREGGRFYGGWWQNIPKEYRKYLDINYKPTVEADFSGLHVRMLYAMEGLQPADDPYDLPGIPRDHQKSALLIMINAKSEIEAIQAFSVPGVSHTQVAGWMHQLARRHAPIAQYFYTGAGTRLQYRDSCIAERVLIGMLDRGLAVLPVHDSFIMRNGVEDWLIDEMQLAFIAEFPQAIPTLRFKETMLEEISSQRVRDGLEPDIMGGELDDEWLKNRTEFHLP